MGVFTSKQLKKLLSPDFSVQETGEGFFIYSGDRAVTAVYHSGIVDPLRGGSKETTQVRAVLNQATRNNGHRTGSKSSYVNRSWAMCR